MAIHSTSKQTLRIVSLWERRFDVTTGYPARAPHLIRWRYMWYVAAGFAVLVLWFLNFVHVFTSLLWTGIDLFMGFILGPILRRQDLLVRRGIAAQLTPRTLFLMPAISFISGTSGWFLAVQLGYTALPWPEFGWVAAALVLVTLMTMQGLGLLMPVNVLVCLELQKAQPDLKKISRWMQFYFYVVATQGAMQIVMIVIMTRFRAGI